MKNLYETVTVNEVKERIGRLQANLPRQWGAMSAAQAVAHCAASMEWAVGDRTPPRAFFTGIVGRMIKSKVLGDDAPFRRNSPTAKDLIVRGQPNFDQEQARLCTLIDRFAAAGPAGCTRKPHSFFGPMKPEEWAILMYKHLDHHLRQFGV
jgi:hypothetical protein